MNSSLRSTLDKHSRSPYPPTTVDRQSRAKRAHTEAANSLVGLANNRSNVDNITQLFRQVSFHEEGTSLNQHDSPVENNEDDTPNAADNGRSVQFDSDGDVEMMSNISQRSNSPPKKKRGHYNPPELKTIEKALEAMVSGMSLTQAANHYNINVTTLKDHTDGFASNGFVTRKKRGPKKKIHFTDSMYKHVCRFVDSNSAASHEEIYDNFQKNFKSANIGQDKLKAYVQKNFRVTLRRHIKPFESDAVENVSQHDCMEDLFTNLGVNLSNCVFVGEAVYDVNPKRTYGDSSKEKVRDAKARKEGRTVNKCIKMIKLMALHMAFLVAICENKVLYVMRKLLGRPDATDMKKFMQKLTAKMHKNDMQQSHIIFDNYLSDEMKDKISQSLVDENYSPIYIPQLHIHSFNPVDALFSHVELYCDRYKSGATNIEDTIFNRFEKAIKEVSSSTLRTCIILRFNCQCDDCV
ncbi:hypothetical protein INT45_012490 [Circinella minor]|uniref:HTH psq-type domain-containing protein n=1 Tax=Circinella minor TaxID=1195481 RepID=A0A8H7RSK3_9FUNG|nr:hypothetical protein INT45_012490 [Circinella minor]